MEHNEYVKVMALEVGVHDKEVSYLVRGLAAVASGHYKLSSPGFLGLGAMFIQECRVKG